jgi:diguanylate cyclase (GGDEF)-like protein
MPRSPVVFGTEHVPVDFLTLLSHSERIHTLIQESAAAVNSTTSQLQQTIATLGLPPGVSELLDNQAVATQILREADAKLTALNQALQREIRERTLINHQLAAAFEQEEGSRNVALHDPLTGLANRVLFNDRLNHGIAQASRHGWLLAVMFVDLNEFKSINDSYGHQAGDALLKSIASRLAHATRHEDTVSRHGGDEFLCLLTPLHEEHHIAMIAAKLLTAIKTPCQVSGRDGLANVWVDGSIGISVFPRDGANSADLIRRADEAMYVAKVSKSGFAFAQ